MRYDACLNPIAAAHDVPADRFSDLKALLIVRVARGIAASKAMSQTRGAVLGVGPIDHLKMCVARHESWILSSDVRNCPCTRPIEEPNCRHFQEARSYIVKKEMVTPVPNTRFGVLAKADSTTTAVRWALCYLGCVAPLVSKPAIVLDIDGTVLKNLPNGGAKCVTSFRTLARACAASDIAIFVVTARPDDQGYNRTWTQNQLKQCGIEPVNALYMRPQNREFREFKLAARKKIRSAGFTVLLSVGDQFADLSSKDYKDLDDHSVWIGTLGDNGSYGIKLASEFD